MSTNFTYIHRYISKATQFARLKFAKKQKTNTIEEKGFVLKKPRKMLNTHLFVIIEYEKNNMNSYVPSNVCRSVYKSTNDSARFIQ